MDRNEYKQRMKDIASKIHEVGNEIHAMTKELHGDHPQMGTAEGTDLYAMHCMINGLHTYATQAIWKNDSAFPSDDEQSWLELMANRAEMSLQNENADRQSIVETMIAEIDSHRKD